MNKIIITTLFAFLITLSHAQAEESLLDKAKDLERQSKAIQNSMHKEVLDLMSDGEKEALSDKLDAQIFEAKSINSQLRNQFRNLDPSTQTNILLRGSN